MTDRTQPLALMLADRLHHEQPTVLRIDAEHAGEELRRQHARIAELEAQLESIGAGGVSGPLMGRASLAASAGSEPVSFTAEHVTYINRYGGRCRDCADESGVCPNRGLPCEDAPKAIKFVLEALAYGINNGYINARVHPSPPEGMVGGWMPIETAPKSSTDGRNVDGIYLLGFCPEPDACNLQSYICIVWWEPNMKGGKGMWYGEGGYEVHPTHWMPLPPPPTTSAGSGKGD